MPDPLCPHCGTPAGTHSANRCLNSWVAESVFGFRRWTCSDYGFRESVLFSPTAELQEWRLAPDLPLSEYGWVHAPFCSQQIVEAWLLIDALAARHWTLYEIGRLEDATGHYAVFRVPSIIPHREDYANEAWGRGDTPQLALCRAALLAVQQWEAK